ncbi:MAG: hypothetical protein M3171_04165 [Actinomycetota bacterium]|nr:hypothetical protein [Actinomycetota bacterium]
MIETPQFRTVLRGADPEQVAEALRELQTSLVVSRRAAADRTIELSRLQEEHQTLQAELQAAQQRLSELEQAGGPVQPEATRQGGGHGYSDLGARIGSMLSLAEEEATQIRWAAEQDAAQRRDQAVRALAVELDAVQARLDETVARTAALGDELDQRRARADEEHGRIREHAAQEAEHIRQQARSDAAALNRQAEEQRAAAVTQRDEIHQHLGRIVQLISGVLEGQPEVTSATTPDERRSDPGRERATGLEPTVDDVTPQPEGAQEAQEAQRPRGTAADATIPDATHPHRGQGGVGGESNDRDHQNTRNGHEEVSGRRRPDGRPVPGSARPADATQVFEPVPAEGARGQQAAVGQSRESRESRGSREARESRREYADAGDSFAGEPWPQEEDGAPAR